LLFLLLSSSCFRVFARETRRHVDTAQDRKRAAKALFESLKTERVRVPSGFINSVIRATRDAADNVP
jgi:hypothetical protein